MKAARRLIQHLHLMYDTPVLVVHDFDKQGIGIFDTLGPGYIDLGLRLEDVEDLDATASEAVSYGTADPRPNLELRGATEDEIDFLCPSTEPLFEGRRVELNALVGTDFTDWLEAKLDDIGVAKVVPDEATIEAAYRRIHERHSLNVAIERAHDQARADAAAVGVPEDIVTPGDDRGRGRGLPGVG